MRHVAVAVVVALGCITAGAAQARPWRHGVIEPKSDSGFILMATTNGFAQKHGIDLQIVPVKNETLGLRALIAGDLDSYEGSPPIAALSRGADVREIGCPWGPLPHVIFARTGIDTVKDLAGKTMATSAPGSMPDVVGRVAVEQAGLAPNAVRLANVGGDADRYRALLGGVVDAAVISSEYMPIIDPQKMHVLAKASDVVPDFLRICYQTTARVLADRPEDAVHFLAMQMDAYRYALANRDATVKLSQATTGQKPDDPRAGFVFDEVMRNAPVDASLPVPAAKIASMQRTLIRLGMAAKEVDLSAIIDARPREKAIASVGQ